MNPIFKDYYDNLNKSNQKHFDKVLTFYPELKPRYYPKVSQKIDQLKCAASTKETMHAHNTYIYEAFFTKMDFLKEVKGFKIGDVVYQDDSKNKIKILEFLEKDGYIHVVTNQDPMFEGYPFIEMLSKEPRPETPTVFRNRKQESFIDSLTISEITSSVRSFLREYSRDTYDFNPFYQRDLVWTTEQKQAFIKALLLEETDVRPTFLDNMYQTSIKKREYEILDGKQRLSAILSYVHNEFSVEGYFYKDLSNADVYAFMKTPMVYKLIKYYGPNGQEELSDQHKIELFLQANEYGQRVSDEHLRKIKEQYLK